MQSDVRYVRFHGTPVARPSPAMPAARPRVGRSTIPPVNQPSNDTSDGLAGFVLSRADLDPSRYRTAPLGRRIPACLRALKVTSEAAARSAIGARPELAGTALDTLLIGVSSFFRDPPVFEACRTRVIPELARRPAPVRILSIGCSTGAEIYSVAMLLAEAGLLERATLLGVDCRPQAIARARSGLFDDHTLSGLDDRRRAAYFERLPCGWRAAGTLRQNCHWQVADATESVPAGPWDLVLCRNLMIYLEPCVTDSLFTRVTETLAAGGFLMVGKAERPPAALKLGAVGRCVYRKS